METNKTMEKIPMITLATARWSSGTHLLRTMGGNTITYNYLEKEFDYKRIEEKLPSVQAFRDFLAEIPLLEDRKTAILDKFHEWDERFPDLEFAAWLIEQYKTLDINWNREQWRLMQASKGVGNSWEELLKARDEEIAELKSNLKEKDAIIALKTKEHDEYVANHIFDSGDEDVHIYKKGKDRGDIRLSKREYVIIEYAIHLLASGGERLSANMKRMIGPENTVSSYINDLKKDGRKPLTNEEKSHIRTVLSKEVKGYQTMLSEYL